MSRPSDLGETARAASLSLAQPLRRVRMLIEECRRGRPGLDGVRDSPTARQVYMRPREWGDDADEYQREDHGSPHVFSPFRDPRYTSTYSVGNRRSGPV